MTLESVTADVLRGRPDREALEALRYLQSPGSGSTLDGAILSGCRTYRWYLWRTAAIQITPVVGSPFDRPPPKAGDRRLCFIMLNPSTADATTDDPTARRVLSFTRQLLFDAVDVVNLFALRGTDPRTIRRHESSGDPENLEWIRCVANAADQVICAWGAHGVHQGRGAQVLRMLWDEGIATMALALTKELVKGRRQPRHPLYLPALPENVPQAEKLIRLLPENTGL